MQELGLIDLGFNGNHYNWNNKRIGHAKIKERVNRGLSNLEWILFFLDAQVDHIPIVSSIHNPICITTDGNDSHPKPFKFESFWTRDPFSHSIISSTWSSSTQGYATFSLSKNI